MVKEAICSCCGGRINAGREYARSQIESETVSESLASERCDLLDRVRAGDTPLCEVKMECCDGVLIGIQAHQIMCKPDIHGWFELAAQNDLYAALSDVSDHSVKYVRKMLSKCVWSKKLTPEIKSFTKHIRTISPHIEATLSLKWDDCPEVLDELKQLKRSLFATAARATADLIPPNRFCSISDNGLLVAPEDIEAAVDAINSVFSIEC